MHDIYHIYDFKYDEKKFMNNFKNIIVEKGYITLSLFHELLKTVGIDSYDTARSYYNKRRVIPVDVLTKLSIKLDLNINKMMFPDSIPVDIYSKNIARNYEAYNRTFDYFNTVFYLYNYVVNPKIKPLTSNDFDSIYSKIEYAANQLSLIISKYNYLLQKFYFSDLNEEEINDVASFSINLLVDRNTNKKLKWDDIIVLKNNLISSDFLNEFYKKYTFSIHDQKCFELLELMKNNLPVTLYRLINNILPECERCVER